MGSGGYWLEGVPPRQLSLRLGASVPQFSGPSVVLQIRAAYPRLSASMRSVLWTLGGPFVCTAYLRPSASMHLVLWTPGGRHGFRGYGLVGG
jgi:hypothetical protein